MIANTTAYTLSRHVRAPSIYEALLEQDGIELGQSRDETADAHDQRPVGRANA